MGTVAVGFYLAVDKIFLPNALGKQMRQAEIQIVFANGSRLPRNVSPTAHWEGNSSLPWEMQSCKAWTEMLLLTLCFAPGFLGRRGINAGMRGQSRVSRALADADSW